MPDQRNAIRAFKETEYKEQTFDSHMNTLGTMITPPDDGGESNPLPKDNIDKAIFNNHLGEDESVEYWYDTIGEDLDLSNFLGKDFLIELTHGMEILA